MENFLNKLGINLTNKRWYHNPDNPFLIEETVRLGRGHLSKDGALVVETGKFTGRAAKDKYVVRSNKTEKTVWWDNDVIAMTSDTFSKLQAFVVDNINKNETIYTTERSVGAHPTHNVSVKLVTTSPSHALFSNHMFRDKIRDWNSEIDFTILHAPDLTVDPKEFGTRSGTVISTNFDTNTVIIVGSLYSGEIKKSIFSVMNYVLPDKGVLPMHAGANKGSLGTSLFFGLSGTGKTTLSTDEGKLLIGDDEHGLSDEGIFNFEGGCYAKTIDLNKAAEPGIWKATNRSGSLIENVTMDPKTKIIDFYDDSITENGRASYPLSFIKAIEPSANGDVPKNIFFLTADAFGVLPPVSKLTMEQAAFYFVLGYTAKVAGTEAGITEPQATFSPCFGAPFMLREPKVYADLLGHYIKKYNIQPWLINTGWTGGPYGVGDRYSIKVTREIIRAVQAGKMENVQTEIDPIFGLNIPLGVSELNSDTLYPHRSWKDHTEYEKKAQALATSFHTQMKKFGDFYQQTKDAAPLFGR